MTFGSEFLNAGCACLCDCAAVESGKTKIHPLRAKKLYVLAAMEMDRYKKKMLDPAAVNLQNTQATYQLLSSALSLLCPSALPLMVSR